MKITDGSGTWHDSERGPSIRGSLSGDFMDLGWRGKKKKRLDWRIGLERRRSPNNCLRKAEGNIIRQMFFLPIPRRFSPIKILPLEGRRARTVARPVICLRRGKNPL